MAFTTLEADDDDDATSSVPLFFFFKLASLAQQAFLKNCYLSNKHLDIYYFWQGNSNISYKINALLSSI